MIRPTLLLVTLLLVLVAAACAPGVPPATTLEVVLTGEAQVPPVETDAAGTANVTLVGNQLRVDGAWSGFDIDEPGAHIHGPASATANAGILGALDYDNAARTFDGTFTLDDDELGYFRDGLLYINLHSAAHPAGELRGQIEP